MQTQILLNDPRGNKGAEHAAIELIPESPEDAKILKELVEEHMLGRWVENGPTAYVIPKLLSMGFW